MSLADNANDQGECWPSIPKICERTCFSERAVHGAIKWLESAGLLSADRSNGRHTRYLVNAEGYQPPQQVQSPPQELRHRSTCATAADAVEPPQEMQEPPQQVQSPPQELRSNPKEPSRTQRSNPHSLRDGRAERFDEFWAAYPIKAGKSQCLAKWKARGLDALADRILADVAAKRTTDRRWLDGFIPNPQTYINQDRWEDPVQPRAGPATKPSVAENFQGKTYTGTPENELPAFLRADAA